LEETASITLEEPGTETASTDSATNEALEVLPEPFPCFV
jgi:hypothetical protein